MGCSSSKIEEAASVQICKDRKNFIKQAVRHRNQLAASHVAYVQSLRRVSIALCTFVDENRSRYFSESCTYHPYRHNEVFIEHANSDVPEEPFELFKSHKTSLERLYAWEKMLYEEVKNLPNSTASPPPSVAATTSLASELRNWRLAFVAWITSQRAYATALSNWAHGCVSDRSRGGPVHDICEKWAKAMETVDDKKAGVGIGILEERMKAMAAKGKRRERGGDEWEEGDWRRVICEGVGEVVTVVGEVAAAAAEAYEVLVREWRNEQRGEERD